MIVNVPLKQFDATKLRDEIAAAGVGITELGTFGVTPFSVTGNRLVITVEDGTDESTVIRVYEAHNPPPEKTRKQILKEQAKASIRSNSPARIADRARDKLIYEVLLETRAYINTLSQALINAGLPVPSMPLSTRTFAQIEAAADAKVDAEVESLED